MACFVMWVFISCPALAIGQFISLACLARITRSSCIPEPCSIWATAAPTRITNALTETTTPKEFLHLSIPPFFQNLLRVKAQALCQSLP